MDEITATPFCSESERFPDGPRTPQVATAETNGYFARFSGKDMFALYPRLKEERDGEGWFVEENSAMVESRRDCRSEVTMRPCWCNTETWSRGGLAWTARPE
jgi:hypothetical protein